MQSADARACADGVQSEAHTHRVRVLAEVVVAIRHPEATLRQVDDHALAGLLVLSDVQVVHRADVRHMQVRDQREQIATRVHVRDPLEERRERLGTEALAVSAHTGMGLVALRGRIVVLNVWGSWCGPCRAEAPLLQRAYPRLTAKGADLVGLDTRESAEPARAFIQAAGLTYPSVSDRDGRLQLAFSDTLPPAAIPSTVIVDAQGRVAARIIGPVDSVTTLLDVVDQVRGVDPSPTASSRPSQSPSGQS